jgi:hypothetical protein
LTWNIEGHLVCPRDEVGHVSVYQVDHHGMDISNNPVLLETLRPLVAIENNGAHKGGAAATYQRLAKLLSPRDIYQLHRNLDTPASDNALPENIANPDSTDGGYGIHVIVADDGNSFRVVNERTGLARLHELTD